MKIISFPILFFIILINVASAGINITVQSENNKTLSIVDLSTFTTVASGVNNQTFSNLTYSNYEVRLLSNSDLTVDKTVSFFNGAWSKLIYLALMILIVFFIYALARGLSK